MHARAAGTRPRRLVRRVVHEAPRRLRGTQRSSRARAWLGERMPRKKGAGKHATGKRKGKGANLEQVLRREASDQPHGHQ